MAAGNTIILYEENQNYLPVFCIQECRDLNKQKSLSVYIFSFLDWVLCQITIVKIFKKKDISYKVFKFYGCRSNLLHYNCPIM